MAVSMEAAVLDFVRSSLRHMSETDRACLALAVSSHGSGPSIQYSETKSLSNCVFAFVASALPYMRPHNIEHLVHVIQGKRESPRRNYESACSDVRHGCRYYYRRDEQEAHRRLADIDATALFVTGLPPYADYREHQNHVRSVLGRDATPINIYARNNSTYARLKFDTHNVAAYAQHLLERSGLRANFQSTFNEPPHNE